MADDLTAELDRIAERAEHMRTRYGNVGGLLALAGAKDDMPRLLAALRAVLELHQPIVRREGWNPTCKYDNHRWPCPEVKAISRELTGKEGPDG